jgi:predicted SAM-dependent methyltransferase
MKWHEVQYNDPLYLNLGGGKCCHPARGYEHYVAIDMRSRGGWAVKHDLRQAIPLPDNSVDRLLTEDFLEHITVEKIEVLLAECYRLLKPGTHMRIGVPDYANPKNLQTLKEGVDHLMPQHRTLTHYDLVREIIERSPFDSYEFYQYWDNGQFIWRPIDYSLGLIQRTPENYYKIYMRGLRPKIHLLLYRWHLRTSTGTQALENVIANIQYGHPLYSTEIVVDLYKR